VSPKNVIIIGVAGALILGCRGRELSLGDNDSVLIVGGVFSPVASNGSGTCEYGENSNLSLESAGRVDVSFESLTSYTPELWVENQGNEVLIVQGALTSITAAGNGSLLETFAAMCADGAGDLAACETGEALSSGQMELPINPFSTLETTMVPPAAGDLSASSSIAVTIVDPDSVAALRSYFENLSNISVPRALTTTIQLVTHTQVMGTTLGGDTVTSNVFDFPVTFGYGSLASNLTKVDGHYCLALPSATREEPCIAGQDSPAGVSSLSGVPLCGTAPDGGASPATPDAGETGTP
jgi:hypothetical protein